MDLERVNLGLGKRPAMIVVDMINGFTDPACPLGSRQRDVVEANVKLLGAMRERGLPVFFTTVIFDNDDQAKIFRARLTVLNLLTPDSRWVGIDPALGRHDDEVLIQKCWASAFFATGLAGQLQEAEVDSLIITGLTTSGCVRATVVDAMQHDYPVVVPREAVGDRNADAHKANLFDMHAKYADVMSVAEVLELL